MKNALAYCAGGTRRKFCKKWSQFVPGIRSSVDRSWPSSTDPEQTSFPATKFPEKPGSSRKLSGNMDSSKPDVFGSHPDKIDVVADSERLEPVIEILPDIRKPCQPEMTSPRHRKPAQPEVTSSRRRKKSAAPGQPNPVFSPLSLYAIALVKMKIR